MLNDHLLRYQCALVNNFVDLTINFTFQFLSIRLQVLNIWECHVTDSLMHTKLSNDLISKTVGFLKVIICTSSYLLEKMKFSTSSTQDKADSINELLLSLKLIFINKILSKSQSTF